jgi:hypothetical protein
MRSAPSPRGRWFASRRRRIACAMLLRIGFKRDSSSRSRALARVAKLIQRIFTVIARSPCDEAIHRAAYAAVDCFAHRTALCAEPAVAHNDGWKIAIPLAAFSAVLRLSDDIDMSQPQTHCSSKCRLTGRASPGLSVFTFNETPDRRSHVRPSKKSDEPLKCRLPRDGRGHRFESCRLVSISRSSVVER